MDIRVLAIFLVIMVLVYVGVKIGEEIVKNKNLDALTKPSSGYKKVLEQQKKFKRYMHMKEVFRLVRRFGENGRVLKFKKTKTDRR